MGTKFFTVYEGFPFLGINLWVQGSGVRSRLLDAVYQETVSPGSPWYITETGLFLGGTGQFSRLSPSGVVESFTFDNSGVAATDKFFTVAGQIHALVSNGRLDEQIVKIDANDRFSLVGDIAPGKGTDGFALTSDSYGFNEIGGYSYFTTFVSSAFNSLNGPSYNIIYRISAAGELEKLGTLKNAVGSVFGPADDPDFTRLNPTTIYFAGIGAGAGEELYKINPVTKVVSLAADINPGKEIFGTQLRHSSPSELTRFGASIYFAATKEGVGRELFKITPSGAVVLAEDINATSTIADSNPRYLTVFGDTLYFQATGAGSGRELWKVDTAGNVSLAFDIRPGSAGSDPMSFTFFNNKLYFLASVTDFKREWFSIDSSGVLKRIDPTHDGVSTLRISVTPDKLFFTDDTKQFSITKSDTIVPETEYEDLIYADFDISKPVKGTANADTRNGTAASEVIFGLNGADTLNGLAGNDHIFGGNDAAIDKISGGIGNDKIFGGLGKDILTGGAGSDAFVFDTALSTANVDTITDFQINVDRIVLDRFVFSSLVGSSISATAFKVLGVPGAVVDANDRIIYNQATGTLAYDRDGSAAAFSPVVFAILSNKPTGMDNLDFAILG